MVSTSVVLGGFWLETGCSTSVSVGTVVFVGAVVSVPTSARDCVCADRVPPVSAGAVGVSLVCVGAVGVSLVCAGAVGVSLVCVGAVGVSLVCTGAVGVSVVVDVVVELGFG